MTYRPFLNDESGFEQWAKSHSFGIVINSSPGRLDKNYVKAHRPDCTSIQRHIGATTVYSKHCFDSAAEALDFLKSNGVSEPTFGCTWCKVSALKPTESEQKLQDRAEVLLKEGFSDPPPGNRTPSKTPTNISELVQRDPAVVAWVHHAADGQCEFCTSNAPFLTSNGRPYLEVHHVKTLAEGGPDTTDNAVALCPNCHRAMHYAKDRKILISEIYRRVPRLKDPDNQGRV